MIVARVQFALGAVVLLALASFTPGEDSAAARELPTNGNIAYVMNSGPDPSRTAARFGLRIMSDDGSNASDLSALMPDFVFVGGPYWSPDGSRLAFDAQTDFEAPGQIYALNADGSGLADLTGDSSLVKGPLSWSPDGSRIAFLGFSEGRASLYMMAPNGSNLTLVTEIDADSSGLSWSPDGSRIAFVSNRDGGDVQNRNEEIYVMNATDGSGQTRLTNSLGYDGDPHWSPDGSKIVFTSYREGHYTAIYVMNSDGSDQRPLIPSHRCALPTSPAVCLGDEQPAWSPDGTMVAFVGFAQEDPGFSDIFVVRADGTDERRLTHASDFEWSPNWQPLPTSETPAPIATVSPTSSPAPASPTSAHPSTEASPPANSSPSPLACPDATPSPSTTPDATASPVGTLPPLSPSGSAFPADVPTVTKAGDVTLTPNYPGGPGLDDQPKTTMPLPAVPQASEPVPSPSPTPRECEQLKSGAEITAQAIGLIALGVLAAGSAVAAPFALLRRRRS